MGPVEITQAAEGMVQAKVGDGVSWRVDVAHHLGGHVVVTVLGASGDYLTMAVTQLDANTVRVENVYLDLETGWEVGGPIQPDTRVIITRVSERCAPA